MGKGRYSRYAKTLSGDNDVGLSPIHRSVLLSNIIAKIFFSDGGPPNVAGPRETFLLLLLSHFDVHDVPQYLDRGLSEMSPSVRGVIAAT